MCTIIVPTSRFVCPQTRSKRFMRSYIRNKTSECGVRYILFPCIYTRSTKPVLFLASTFFFFKFFTSKCTIYTKYLLFLFFMGSNQPNQTCKCQYTGRQTLINAFWNTCVIVVITPKTAVIGYNFLFRLIYRL